GDAVRLAPQVELEVARVQPGRSLVLRGGVPLGDAPPPYDFTWAFVLEPQSTDAARLLVRERYAYTRAWRGLLVEPVELISFVMTQRMLRGIRDRAEAAG
ncbi:MAG: SRPBCC family protein, partial [Candidatus Dormibacteraeota bacterium]|nr:SRPBCC family protein [Candidatus Dormibacteraeota bacterium]